MTANASVIGGRAVVLGASMAGLCAARVLSERFDEVVVVDRDVLPAGPEWRKQVPQGRQPHLLLVAGARLLEGWFPGIVDELEREGAVEVDVCADLYWYEAGGVQRRPSSTLLSPAMSRPLLERVVRHRVETLTNVVIRDECAGEGLVADETGRSVVGVRLSDGTIVESRLVVDATGRQARSLPWLRELGYEPPATTTVEVDTRYVSRLLRRGEHPARDWKMAAIIDEPAAKRLAIALPIEGDRWIVMFGGMNGEVAPIDDAGMLAYARTFGSAAIAEIIEASEPLSDPATHRFPANQRRHVEKLRRFPLGWIVLGDAVASFDPIYGQGMTSAAQQAEALGVALDRSRTVDRSFARRYFKAAARAVGVPWSMAVGGDFVYDGTKGKKPFGTDFLNRYMQRVSVASQHDDAVVRRLNAVFSLVRRPESILTPAFVLRVLRAARRGPTGSTTVPRSRSDRPSPPSSAAPGAPSSTTAHDGTTGRSETTGPLAAKGRSRS